MHWGRTRYMGFGGREPLLGKTTHKGVGKIMVLHPSSCLDLLATATLGITKKNRSSTTELGMKLTRFMH